MKLSSYFDRVVLINMRQRPDRLEKAREALRACRWPFKSPELFEAVDGYVLPPPEYFTQGAGAWGCLNSHKQILERAIADGVQNVLILEDDICFADNFREQVGEFLREVPDDWDQLMIGGQHMLQPGRPTLIKPGIFRCVDCERTHCYAVRGDYMRRLVERWSGGGTFQGNGHCDWIMGRDPELQARHKVYAPEFFLVGQDRAKSDINHRVTPRQFWNPPGKDLMVINLHAPQPVVAALREYGFHTGYDRERLSDCDNSLIHVFEAEDPASLQAQLRTWIKVIQWEVASDPRMICTIWHPLAEPALVVAASLWPVFELTAESLEEALRQLPQALQRPRMPDLLLEHRFPPGHRFRASPPPTPADRPPIPTVAELANNFGQTMVGWAKAGFKVVKRKEYAQRHEICSACEYWQQDARLGTGMCRQCGCSGVKLWLATATCPDRPPRW